VIEELPSECSEALERLARFDLVMRGMRDVALLLDADTRILFASPSITMLLGGLPSDYLGQSGLDLVHPDDISAALEGIDRARFNTQIENPEVSPAALRLLRTDGSYLATDVVGSIEIRPGLTDLIVLVVRDATERVAFEHALRSSENRLTAIVDTAPDAIVSIGVEGRIQSFNTAAERMFGYTADEIVGRDVTVLMPAPHAAEHAGHLTRYLATSTAMPHGMLLRTRELTALRRDGSEFPVSIGVGESNADEQRCFTAIIRDISELRDYQDQLQFHAAHDALTGLPNRRALVKSIRRAQQRAQVHGSMLGVLFLDLDRFKLVNDSLGHTAGDRLLLAAADRLNNTVRASDIVARIGGDEFVVLCPEVSDIEELTAIADRIHAAFSASFDIGREVLASASIGIAAENASMHSPDDLLKHADIAMYRAKEAGRACTRVFDDEMLQSTSARLDFDNALRHAVERGELRLEYQPIVDLESGLVAKTEALVRWDRPGHGCISPAQFIPHAEETGLIVPIGKWVLERACRQAAAWHAAGHDLGISVNVSSRQLDVSGFVADVRAAIAAARFPAHLLTIEITESALMSESARALLALEEIRAMGIEIALDDFGTGYSSLTYLRRFPITCVKIDRSFVRALGTDREDTAIVAATVSLAGALELSVVAEGVSEPEHLAALLNLGCKYGQGYLFAKPMTPEAHEEWVATRHAAIATGRNRASLAWGLGGA
jgi:diguanylate cyclase (GGDEF)-like protein/PAS domain S-box-containing protein